MAVNFSGLGRDVKCAGDVGRMAALGKFNVEFDGRQAILQSEQ